MNEKERMDALSAFLDGEAERPETVRRALEADLALRERADAYRRMCAELRALPKPEVHPAFATRVMAAIRDEAPAPRRSLRWAWAAGFAGAAAVALYTLLPRTAEPPVEAPLVQLTSGAPANGVLLGDDVVLNQMELRLESGEELVLFGEEESEESAMPEPDWLDTMYDEVYASLDDYEAAQDEGENLLLMLDALETPEREVLESLLRSYLEKV